MRKSATIFGAALAAIAAVAIPSPAQAQRGGGGYWWQGAYAGANLGYQWGSVTNNSTKPSGAIGGLQVGYNWQRQQFVFGAETDIQVSGADDTFAPYKFSNPWFGTLRGRAGIAVNNTLFYGTAGLAYGTLRGQNTLSGVSESRTSIGWAAGLGMEVGFSGRWTAKVEYLYVDISDRGFAITGANNGLESNIMRIGVNYRF